LVAPFTLVGCPFGCLLHTRVVAFVTFALLVVVTRLRLLICCWLRCYVTRYVVTLRWLRVYAFTLRLLYVAFTLFVAGYVYVCRYGYHARLLVTLLPLLRLRCCLVTLVTGYTRCVTRFAGYVCCVVPLLFTLRLRLVTVGLRVAFGCYRIYGYVWLLLRLRLRDLRLIYGYVCYVWLFVYVVVVVRDLVVHTHTLRLLIYVYTFAYALRLRLLRLRLLIALCVTRYVYVARFRLRYVTRLRYVDFTLPARVLPCYRLRWLRYVVDLRLVVGYVGCPTLPRCTFTFTFTLLLFDLRCTFPRLVTLVTFTLLRCCVYFGCPARLLLRCGYPVVYVVYVVTRLVVVVTLRCGCPVTVGLLRWLRLRLRCVCVAPFTLRFGCTFARLRLRWFTYHGC